MTSCTRHPHKVQYDSAIEATIKAEEVLNVHGSPQRVHDAICSCGSWHLTTKSYNGSPLTAAQVREWARLAKSL